LLLAQSTGRDGAVAAEEAADDDNTDDHDADDEGDADRGDGERGDAERGDAERGDAAGDRARDAPGGEGAAEMAGDRGVDVAAIRCAARSVAEIGWQAAPNTPMISIQRITLVIRPAWGPDVDQPHRRAE
jgi:hypothetical protein